MPDQPPLLTKNETSRIPGVDLKRNSSGFRLPIHPSGMKRNSGSLSSMKRSSGPPAPPDFIKRTSSTGSTGLPKRPKRKPLEGLKRNSSNMSAGKRSSGPPPPPPGMAVKPQMAPFEIEEPPTKKQGSENEKKQCIYCWVCCCCFETDNYSEKKEKGKF